MNNKQMEMMAREHEITAVDPVVAVEVADAAAKHAVSAYQKIENAVVGGYKKIEDGVVGSYKKVENAFVGAFLTREGESVEDAKKRLNQKEEK